jgi:hypothetical protein
MRLVAVLLLPSWPLLLKPQHCTPPLTTAQVWREPAATAVAPLPAAIAWTGEGRWTVLLSPSWPSLPLPQHCTPPATTAQLWLPPAVTLVALGSAMTLKLIERLLVPAVFMAVIDRVATLAMPLAVPVMRMAPVPTWVAVRPAGAPVTVTLLGEGMPVTWTVAS